MSEHGGAPAVFGDPSQTTQIKSKEWDKEFYRESLDYLIVKGTIGKCAKCQGTIRKDGVAGNTYRLKCSQCGASVGGASFNTLIEENIKEIIDAKPGLEVYGKRAPRRQEPVLKGQNQLPTAPKRRALVKTSESDEEEDEISRNGGLGALIKRLKELEKALKERDETMKKRDEMILELQREVKALKNRTTEEDHNGKTKEKPKDGFSFRFPPMDGSKTQGLGKKTEKTKTLVTETPVRGPLVTATQNAWQGPKPDWQTAGRRGKMVKATASRKDDPPKKKELSQEELARFISGQAPKQKGLKFLYIKGVQKWKYSQMRTAFAMLGVPSHWIRHFAMVANDILEMMVFEERAEEIKAIISEKAACYEILTDHDPLQGSRKDLKNAEARLRRQIGRLPGPMHSTRKVLNRQLEATQRRLNEQSTEEKEATVSKDMDVIEIETSISGPCNGVQRTDV